MTCEEVDKCSRNWVSYLTDALVNSGTMPTWEAVDYLTSNLFGEAPNSGLHDTKQPYESIYQFLHRVYGPIVEAATRHVGLPQASMIHMFTDISLIGNSAVLVVYFPGGNMPHQLLLLDGVKPWELVFADESAFNRWAEERFSWITSALESMSAPQETPSPVEPTVALQT